MLVGCGVENVARVVFLECVFHSVAVGDVAYVEVYAYLRIFAFKFELHVVHRRFGLIEEYDVASLEFRYLADYLTAD